MTELHAQRPQGLQNGLDALHAELVTGDAREALLLRPASVAVHDESNMDRYVGAVSRGRLG